MKVNVNSCTFLLMAFVHNNHSNYYEVSTKYSYLVIVQLQFNFVLSLELEENLDTKNSKEI